MNRLVWIGLLVALICSGSASAQYPDADSGDIGVVTRLYLDDIVAGREDKSSVELYVRAETRYGEPVETLRSVDLAIHDNAELVDSSKVTLDSVFEAGEPVSAVVVLDRGQRTIDDRAFALAKDALEKMADAAREQDSIAIVSFADETSLVSPLGATQQERAAAIAGLAAAQHPTSESKLYDAIYTAVEHIRSPDSSARRGFVIVFTGGPDQGSSRSLEELIDLGRGGEFEARVPIFAVAYAGPGRGYATSLQALSEGTAAKSFQATSPIHLPSLFQEIWRQMTRSYVIRYAAQLDGEMHKVEISVDKYSEMRMVTYPEVASPIWGWAIAGVLGVAAGVALWHRSRLKNQLMGRLIFVGGQEAGREVLLRGPGVRIGALPDNDVVIGSGAVSRRHAVVQLKGGVVEIEDLETRNGTFVNGSPIKNQPLQSGDKIRIADVDMVYEK